MYNLQLSIANITFSLDAPQSVSREVQLFPHLSSSNAFDLPRFEKNTVTIGDFVGDVTRGGSCNVDVYSFCPHNLTHIETSAHITQDGQPVNKIPLDTFSGVVYLIDLSENQIADLITTDFIQNKIETLEIPCDMIAIKTRYSLESPFKDFTGTDPIAIHPQAATYLNGSIPKIKGIILDLPSADGESDGGKLQAHRNFLGLPSDGLLIEKEENRIIVELAYFHTLKEGYYYYVLTPPRTETNAAITDIFFYKMVRK
ncbi:MAG: cyclase family protein [Candidatus Kariarchaeaceae archaeon]|jgi:kynurenine formamidase